MLLAQTETKVSRRRRTHAWHPWFAWRPVRTVDAQWVWLETVERVWFLSKEVSSDDYKECAVILASLNWCFRRRTAP